MRRIALVALAAAACGTPTDPTGTGRVRIALSGTPDTLRFEVAVVAAKCGNGAGVLVHGERRGQGLLVWLRGGEQPDTGTYPLLSRGDSTAPRGAIASVRYMVGDVAHGFALDDGVAIVARAIPPLRLQVRGHGVETAVAGQRSGELVLEDVTLAPDTVPCHVLR